MCDVFRLSLLQSATFSQTPPSPGAWSRPTLCTAVKHFITLHSVIHRHSQHNYSRHAGCYSPIQELCLCWPLRLETPWPWNYYPCHLSSRRDDLRLPCLLTQALMPLESIANLNDAIVIWLHYITFSLTCGLRTVYFVNLKNLICVDIVKCHGKFCLLLYFLHWFLTNLASTGGPHEIRRRAACGPRVGQHCTKW